jgi:radical SAM superfamily enzyme YgiQ (UPF0313 family)
MKKKILLVNPYIEDFSAYDHFSKPLGIIWLASYLKKHFDVFFINVLKRNHPLDPSKKFKDDGTGEFPKKKIKPPLILSDIPRDFKRYGISEEIFVSELKKIERPDYIFVTSGMTYWYTGVSYTVKILREIFPEAKIFLGGIYASILPEHAKKNINPDFIIPFQEILLVLKTLENYFGVEFEKEFLFPSYELLGEYYYLPLLTSTGCIFNCSYCIGPKLSSFRQFDSKKFASLVKELFLLYDCRNFAFYDDALLYNSEKHLNPFLEELIDLKLPVRFYTPNGLHIRFLTLQTATLMKAANFVDVRLSLESIDENFISKSSNKTRVKDFLNSMEILYKAGFERKNIKVYILLNIPRQSLTSVEKTMHFVFENGAIPMLAYYSPIPGTPDFMEAMKITDVSEPLFQNNTVYLYRSGLDIDYFQYLKNLEKHLKEEILKSS